MIWHEGGSPQHSLVCLIQLLWQQADLRGFGLYYSDLCKKVTLQVTNMLHFSSQILKVFLLRNTKT